MPYATSGEPYYHGPSIKNPATYEALVNSGKSKASAAAISNAAIKKGYRKGKHRSKITRRAERRRGG